MFSAQWLIPGFLIALLLPGPLIFSSKSKINLKESNKSAYLAL
jgi:hypothetical protein